LKNNKKKMQKNRQNNNSSRILIRSVNWLGDAVMTLPALSLIRRTLPKAHIFLVVPQKLTDLWVGQPYADTLLSFDPGWSLFSGARLIRMARARSALILPNSPRSAMELWLSRIPIRVGYRAKWRRAFLSHAIDAAADYTPMRKRTAAEVKHLVKNPTEIENISYSPAAHHIYHYVHLACNFLESLGVTPELPVDLTPHFKISPEKQKELIDIFGIDESSAASPLMGVNAGAEYGPAKRWPLDYFARTMVALSEENNVRWLLFGGHSDRAMANELRARCRSLYPGIVIYQLTGRTSLSELVPLANLCEIFLTNDTGPMHVAAAAGTTVLTPFLSTSPELTCPGSPLDDKLHPNRHILLRASETRCSPCFLKQCPIDFSCAREISPEVVISAIRNRLSRTESDR
jgi:lipopolysaccharide heptosyltransferase II